MPRNTSARGQDREAKVIDAHVGHNVRQRRLLIGASQEALGKHLGLTFQQVQKYEKGTNRIGAGRLFQIADFLGVPVDTLFKGLGSHSASLDRAQLSKRERIMQFAATREGVKWIEGYLNAPHPRQRKLALDLLHLPATPDEP